MQDYNYFETNALEVLVEMDCCKFPYAKELPIQWQNHKESMLSYMQFAHRGVKGQIK